MASLFVIDQRPKHESIKSFHLQTVDWAAKAAVFINCKKSKKPSLTIFYEEIRSIKTCMWLNCLSYRLHNQDRYISELITSMACPKQGTSAEMMQKKALKDLNLCHTMSGVAKQTWRCCWAALLACYDTVQPTWSLQMVSSTLTDNLMEDFICSSILHA